MNKLSKMIMACMLGASVAIGCKTSAVYAEPVSIDNVVVVDDVDESVFQVAKFSTRDSYRLAKYDSLQIVGTVLTSSYTDLRLINVDADGMVRLPYVGNVKVAGLTVQEARDLLYSKLSHYYKIPDFDISVKTYGARKVYVTGNVKNPGVKEMHVDNMNVYAAIATAGGVDNRGRSKHVQILRQIDEKLYFKEVNMDGFVKDHDMSQNLAIEDGDIVYVPDSGKIIWSEDIIPYINVYTLYRTLVK